MFDKLGYLLLGLVGEPVEIIEGREPIGICEHEKEGGHVTVIFSDWGSLAEVKIGHNTPFYHYHTPAGKLHNVFGVQTRRRTHYFAELIDNQNDDPTTPKMSRRIVSLRTDPATGRLRFPGKYEIVESD
jgi:hypothetical protein